MDMNWITKKLNKRCHERFQKEYSKIEGYFLKKIIINSRGIWIEEQSVHFYYGTPEFHTLKLTRWLYRCNYQVPCIHSRDGYTYETECHHPSKNFEHMGDEFHVCHKECFEPFFFDFNWSRFRNEWEDYENEHEKGIGGILL